MARLLGGTIDVAQQDVLDVRASVMHGLAWTVALTTRHGGQIGQRSIEASTCQSVADATALIIALIIDPDAVAAQAQLPKGKMVPAKPALGPPPPAPPTQVATVRQPLDVLASIYAQGRIGALPKADVGMGFGAGLVGRRWRMELQGTYGLRRDQVAYLASQQNTYGRFSIFTGALAACLNLGSTALAFGPCAITEAGFVSVDGYGATHRFSQRAPWAALGAGGYLSFAVGRHLLALLQADAMVPVWRPEYVFRDLPGVVYQAPAVGGRLLVGVAWRF